MNKLSCVFFFLALIGCAEKSSHKTQDNLPPADSLKQTSETITGTVNPDSSTKTFARKTTTGNTLVIMPDSLFKELELDLEEISKVAFDNYNKTYKTSCPVDANGFPENLGLTVSDTCGEICEAYLVDKKNKKFMHLPSGYDSGILGLLPSPNCRQFVVFSSYDQPDFDKFYAYRATIYGFAIGKGTGLATIRPAFRIATKAWSLADLVWVNDNVLALQTYEEGKVGNGSGTTYKYFKAKLNR